MKVIVLGGTGATGRLVVSQLLKAGDSVTALVRPGSKLALSEDVDRRRLSLIEQTALSMQKEALTDLLREADAVVSCLGHNLSWRGVYGAPRMLVRNSLQRVLTAVPSDRATPLKIVLMNTTGNRNLDLKEAVPIAQHLVLILLRCLLPPHLDNERAANLLRKQLKDQGHIEWVAVRPDSLTDEKQVNSYSLHPSPIRSAIFDSGKTSRINTADFICRLVQQDKFWQKWRGQMPVI